MAQACGWPSRDRTLKVSHSSGISFTRMARHAQQRLRLGVLLPPDEDRAQQGLGVIDVVGLRLSLDDPGQHADRLVHLAHEAELGCEDHVDRDVQGPKGPRDRVETHDLVHGSTA
jgi:hypothetical protein